MRNTKLSPARLTALSLAALATVFALASCGGSSAPDAISEASSTTLPETSSTTLAVDTTLPVTPAATAPVVTVPPPSAPAPSTPITTAVPKVTTTTSAPKTANQVVSSTTASLQSAFGQGDFAPVYQTIWDKVQAAGGSIRVSGSDASDPSNPTRPQAAGAYVLSISGSTYCIKMVMNEDTLRAEYVTSSGAC